MSEIFSEPEFTLNFDLNDFQIGYDYGFNEKAFNWYEIGYDNLKAANILYDGGLYSQSVYFIQQAAEVFIKGVFNHVDMIKDENVMKQAIKHLPHKAIYNFYKERNAEVHLHNCDVLKGIIDKGGENGKIFACVKALALLQDRFNKICLIINQEIGKCSKNQSLINLELNKMLFIQDILFVISYSLRDSEYKTRYPSNNFDDTPRKLYDKDKDSIKRIIEYLSIVPQIWGKSQNS